jgi:hypothetical protein
MVISGQAPTGPAKLAADMRFGLATCSNAAREPSDAPCGLVGILIGPLPLGEYCSALCQ